jgi:hypothetical protein
MRRRKECRCLPAGSFDLSRSDVLFSRSSRDSTGLARRGGRHFQVTFFQDEGNREHAKRVGTLPVGLFNLSVLICCNRSVQRDWSG